MNNEKLSYPTLTAGDLLLDFSLLLLVSSVETLLLLDFLQTKRRAPNFTLA
jgi:hypothetical protein